MKFKILHIVGARPQFVKLYPLHKELCVKGIYQKILHTGQHFDEKMSGIFFKQLGIPTPDYNLDIHSLPHGAMTGRMIEEIEKILVEIKPTHVIVYGDTNSTLAGTIAASKISDIEIVHIEAGVRNYDNTMPEEINRIVTDRLSHKLLCCTDKCVQNLKSEGLSNAVNTGDLMYDSMLLFRDKLEIDNKSKPYVLVTCHRASNTSAEVLREIVEALNIISTDHMDVIFPIHPRTRKIIDLLDIEIKFKLVEPVSYFDMLTLLANCEYVLTDSGGVVREAYFFNKLSLLLLKSPLWPELVEANVCINTDVTKNCIVDNFNKLLENKIYFKEGLLGDGNSRTHIVNNILC